MLWCFTMTKTRVIYFRSYFEWELFDGNNHRAANSLTPKNTLKRVTYLWVTWWLSLGRFLGWDRGIDLGGRRIRGIRRGLSFLTCCGWDGMTDINRLVVQTTKHERVKIIFKKLNAKHALEHIQWNCLKTVSNCDEFKEYTCLNFMYFYVLFTCQCMELFIS